MNIEDDNYLNTDGKTYNGVKMFADFTGLDEVYVSWVFERLKQLMTVDKLSKEESLSIIKLESKREPWIKK